MLNNLCANQIAFTIGNIDVAWYGLIVTFGIISGFLLFLHMSKKQGLDDDFTLESFLWVVILAIIFARVFYVVPRIGKTYHTFYEMINIREGGLTIVGGIFGGILGLIISTLKNRQYHLATLSDAAPLPLLLGQAIGRWGNFVNQELFGLQITNPALQRFPFAVYIDHPSLHYPGYESGWYCALFFYEGVLNSIALVVGYLLYRKYKDKMKPMTMTLAYLTWYGLVRGMLEFLKIDHETIGNTNIGSIQVISFVMAIVGIVLIVLLYTNKINFNSDWFQKLIDDKKAKILAKKASKENAITQENIQVEIKNEEGIDDEKSNTTN